jgi:hypothetical protein
VQAPAPAPAAAAAAASAAPASDGRRFYASMLLTVAEYVVCLTHAQELLLRLMGAVCLGVVLERQPPVPAAP